MNYFALSVKPNASRIYKISYLAARSFSSDVITITQRETRMTTYLHTLKNKLLVDLKPREAESRFLFPCIQMMLPNK